MSDLAVKFTGRDTIAGLAIPFGAPDDRDLDGEYFTVKTDLAMDWFPEGGRPVLYDHGLDDEMRTIKIGQQTDYEVRDEGVWAESQLGRNVRYRKAIDKLIAEGALGYSSGAVPHLTQKSRSGEITRWPWVELSVTPIPAHPGTLIHYVKAVSTAWGDATPDPESLHDRLVRVSDELASSATHASEYAEMRVKAGRVLSRQNREQIAAVLEALESFEPHREALRTLLVHHDPDAKTETEKALNAALFEALLTEARLLGV